MRVVPERYVSLPTVERVLTTASPEFSTATAVLGQSTASTTWFAANDPIAYPFRLSEPGIVKKLGWVNGSAAGGNVDVGIYSTAWVRLISTGSTGGVGNSLWQWIDVTDTPLAAGKYYLVCARDNITANRVIRWGNALTTTAAALVGIQDTTTNSFPLPNPLAGMGAAATSGNIYLLGMKLQRVVY